MPIVVILRVIVSVIVIVQPVAVYFNLYTLNPQSQFCCLINMFYNIL